MQVAVIGLGRMGSGVARRLLAAGEKVVVYNRTPSKTVPFVEAGATAAESLQELVSLLAPPRVVWLYLPAGEVAEEHLKQLITLLSPGDTIIDGGNSHFGSSVYRATQCKEKNINFIDVGTSGGVRGEEVGYCLMMGGEEEIIHHLQPLWQAVAIEGGFAHVGPAGSGHYVKMVHNAIEYGMMQAYGEGAALLAAQDLPWKLNLEQVADLWQHGSIIRSFLGELLAEGLHDEARLESVNTVIADNSEARWAIEEGLNQAIALPVISAALYARYASRGEHPMAAKVVNVLRQKFGGHTITP